MCGAKARSLPLVPSPLSSDGTPGRERRSGPSEPSASRSPDSGDPLESRALYLSERQARLPECSRQLGGSLARVPLRLEPDSELKRSPFTR